MRNKIDLEWRGSGENMILINHLARTTSLLTFAEEYSQLRPTEKSGRQRGPVHDGKLLPGHTHLRCAFRDRSSSFPQNLNL